MIRYVGPTATIEVDAEDNETIVETALMREVLHRTTRAMNRSGRIVSWAGPQGNGKTATAGWLTALAEHKLLPGYEGRELRVKHYRAGQISDGRAAFREGIKSLAAVMEALTPHALNKWSEEKIVKHLVHAFEAHNVQMVIVDDVDDLCEAAIKGMTMVLDSAKVMGWKLTLVFVGHGDLIETINGNGRVQRRTVQWCYFEPYDLPGMQALMAGLYPQFAQLDMRVPEQLALLEFIKEKFSGLPGGMVPFLDEVVQESIELGSPIDLDYLWAVYFRNHTDRARTYHAAEGRHAHLIPLREKLKLPDADASPEEKEEEMEPERDTDPVEKRRKA